jgi:ADP-heptose:LPS heptosyltransferase
MAVTVFFSKLWKTIYKNPRNRWKEERFLKQRLALVDSIKQTADSFDKEVFIIRTDDIGDYILFRNTLEVIRKAYPNYKITLLGHQLWKPIAESWDSDFVDEFIWLDKGRFLKDDNYAHSFLEQSVHKKPELLLAPSYSRSTFIDGVIAQLIPAQKKWCWQRNDKETRKWLRKYCDAPFTNTLPIPDGLHEFDLNKRFVEELIKQKIALEKPEIPKDKLPTIEGLPLNFVVLFPGAAAKRKRWSTNNFAQIADYIFSAYQLPLVICGSEGDKGLVVEIAQKSSNKEAIIDFTGKTDLIELATVINQCQLIISNDTSAAHYAAALGKNTIALLNGNSYGRFFPYPNNHTNIIALYPSSITNPPHDWVGRGDINTIKVGAVAKEVDKLFKD